ncbi:hypothetical protein ATE47_01345 [Chryseobacterium sp. IHB B 17019]|uniref:hypothetical protein n=1 Tax=Chryseobacterium sp. IHB B 17019 TaxID=1721091 RepID=UPI00071ECA8F|nr:hypothetical protein [Chryseobacterium sp. IHB B 17019]ALR29257.1 hypothetical protein ATE47_01345 [Chryseobacterium sp. IHB B 17019]
MDIQQPTSEELETYKKVDRYLKSKMDQNNDQNRLSILPKPQLLFIIILALVAFSCYYGLTTMLFGEEFWVRSITGAPLK